MRQQTFFFTAASVRPWIVDKDTVLSVVVGNVNYVVSTDQNLTSAYVLSPTEDFIADALLIPGNASNLPIKIPLSAGTTILVEATAAGYVQLYLEDVILPAE